MTVNTKPARSALQIIPAKYANFVMPVLLSIFMTFIVSLISTLRSTGVNENTLHVWMSSWGNVLAYCFPYIISGSTDRKKANSSFGQTFINQDNQLNPY